jgi:pimeloyl-ACP methyl ester carboxylesterase
MAETEPLDRDTFDDLRAPNWWMLMLEGRAPWEYAALVASLPVLKRLPRGDGHPVLVFPGLGANDFTTVPMRRLLDDLGYTTFPWHQGFNFGPRHGVLARCRDQVAALADRHGQKVSLIGWSLGGIYAREMAKELPHHVRCVVTLGTPFTGHARATNAWRFFELVSGQAAHDPVLAAKMREAPPVPTTSVYSKTDGIVHWRCSINRPGPLVENIRVRASHVGMGLHPAAMFVIGDRLAQPDGGWKPFEPVGPQGLVFDTRHPER